MNEPEVAAGVSTEAQLQGFLNMFEPEVGDVARGLPDPDRVLQGSGKQVRTVRLTSASDVLQPAVTRLVDLAAAAAEPPFDPDEPSRLVIKFTQQKVRPRRPSR